MEEQAAGLDAMYKDGKFVAVGPFVPSTRLSMNVDSQFCLARSLELLT
jgi:uncharacterized protein YciI